MGRFFLSLSLFLGFVLPCTGQTISVGFTTLFNHIRQKVRMADSKDYFDNTTDAFYYTYDHQLKNKKFSVFGSFMNYKGVTMIRFREGSVIATDGFPTVANGFKAVRVNRIDFGMAYNLLDPKKKFYFKPFAGIGFQISNKNDFIEYGYLDPVNGPDYAALEPITAEQYNTFQLAPLVGFKTGFIFWKRLDLGLSFMGLYGYKSYQSMFFKYSYKGEPQETAIFESTGTGIYPSISIGFRFIKV